MTRTILDNSASGGDLLRRAVILAYEYYYNCCREPWCVPQISPYNGPFHSNMPSLNQRHRASACSAKAARMRLEREAAERAAAAMASSRPVLGLFGCDAPPDRDFIASVQIEEAKMSHAKIPRSGSRSFELGGSSYGQRAASPGPVWLRCASRSRLSLGKLGEPDLGADDLLFGGHGVLRRHFTQINILQPNRIAFSPIRHLGRSPSERTTDVGLRVTAHFRLPFALVAAQKKAAGKAA